jgi:hydroxypyruvate isomerase
MQRRDFMVGGAAVGAGIVAAGVAMQSATAQNAGGVNERKKFKLKYAPHFDMFKELAGPDPIDQLKFGADQGFEAWEDNWFKRRPVEEQEKIGQAMADLGIQMGVFVADFARGTAFTGSDQAAKEEVLKNCRECIEPAKRAKAKWMTLVTGNFEFRYDWGLQMANCVDLLRRVAEIFEPHGLVACVEPLNWRRDHPGIFMHTPYHCYEACHAVNSPAVKMIYDLYHTQVQSGNLINGFDDCRAEIAYVQTGDHPGRNEPGTGEINYRNVFKHLYEQKYDGIVGLEHGISKPGKEGEEALIAAYRAADDF